MTGTNKTKLLYAGIGIFFGWMFGGLVNAVWFLYSVTKLGYGGNDPNWYATMLGLFRIGVLLASMVAGYLLSQYVFRRSPL